MVLYTAKLYYPIEVYIIEGDATKTIRRGIVPIHSDIKVSQNDWSKKVATDALTKGLSLLGFNADVFLGKFEDNKYVQELKKNGKDINQVKTDIINIMKTDKFDEDERNIARHQFAKAKTFEDFKLLHEVWLKALNEKS
jgi:hypothetical protein